MNVPDWAMYAGTAALALGLLTLVVALVPRSPGPESAEERVASYTARITALANEGVGELMALVGVTDALDVSAMVSVWISIFDSLVDWWLDHPDQDAAAMTQRCVRLFAAVTRADLGSVLA